MGGLAHYKVKPSTEIGEAFASYRKIAIHPDAGPTQLNECKKAFYAGALAMQTAAAALDLGAPGVEMTLEQLNAGAQRMEELRLELEEFAASLMI